MAHGLQVVDLHLIDGSRVDKLQPYQIGELSFEAKM